MGRNGMGNLELLYNHYKDTNHIIKEHINQRNKFFVLVLFVIAFQFIFAISPESIFFLITEIIRNRFKIDISGQAIIIQNLLWIILLYLTARYYQSSIYIERLYKYIHAIETRISSFSGTSINRESEEYLKDYPIVSDLIDALYKIVFPVIYCIVILYKIICECINTTNVSIVFNFIMFLLCFVMTVLYFVCLNFSKVCSFEHKEKTN